MIDRKTLVRRHNPRVRHFDPEASLSVGNGEFAVTVDATGLQSFPALYEQGGVPLGTMSNWGWHSDPNPQQYRVEAYPKTRLRTFGGREIAFSYSDWLKVSDPATTWLRNNPHRLHLGHVQFRFLGRTRDRRVLNIDAIDHIDQTLDLWTGMIHSRYTVDGVPIEVRTVCHPSDDLLAVDVRSPLLRDGRIQVGLHFPYGSALFSGTDFSRPSAHQTRLKRISDSRMELFRILDDTQYHVALGGVWQELVQDPTDSQAYWFTPKRQDDTQLVVAFSPNPHTTPLPTFEGVAEASRGHGSQFWSQGGAIELAQSRDPRAPELERRLILSQYLTRINSSGTLPPQESGLVHNSWAGKFHLEMHWWHSAHFALWGRPHLLQRNLQWYESHLQDAKRLACDQGYEGARWPKCVGPEGINAPCYIEPFLIWQEPHPIYYAELLYRSQPTLATLQRYAQLVFESATFMASFAEWDEAHSRYVLGPPLAPAQEIYDHTRTMNSPLELEYWYFGLGVAQTWRERLSLPRVALWDQVRQHLAPLAEWDGIYVGAESHPDGFRERTAVHDHPSMVAPLGMLPGHRVNRQTMERTLHAVLESWQWDHTWGWDYPMLAMTAARLDQPGKAVDLLLIQKGKNRYLANGHNFQHRGLPVYLPGNGGLLTAAAMMARGWDQGPRTDAPGFPSDGSWTVEHEGLAPMP